MAKGKDFYGKDVTEVISKACEELSVSQGELDIEVLETGSAGIFGLCKKKAHIRVTRRTKQEEEGRAAARVESASGKPKKAPVQKKEKNPKNKQAKQTKGSKEKPKKQSTAHQEKQKEKTEEATPQTNTTRELPSDEVLATVKDDIVQLVAKMGFPSEVSVALAESGVECRISGDYEEALIGNDGRTLDSLQYLLRKMLSRRLPERMMVSLDVGNYREQRAQELEDRALELAEQVKTDGKTQAIAALNPSERRVVHMILQEDKAIRSRSVGEGLFKKVLIYKPGKKNKSGSRKGKGRQGGRSSGNK
jgi:spoIIIJ-associated protein